MTEPPPAPPGQSPGVAPTVDREAQRERLDRFLALRHVSAPDSSFSGRRVEPGPQTAEHPLSLGQEQIWLHSKLSPDRSAYNEPLTLTHRGPLDAQVLRQSLAEIIRRHEAWRTTFREVDGRPVSVVLDPPAVELPIVDLRHLAPEAAEAEAIRLATEDTRRPFDLEVGPLLRFLLVILGADEQRLYLALHQIVFDGVSMYSGFLPEVAAIYADLLAGRPVSLAPPAAQYRDFVGWQRESPTDARRAAQLAYWQAQLGEFRAPLELPTDRPRPALQRYDGEQISFALPADLSEELRAFSRREGVTLFTTLLAAFAAFLMRRTADDQPTIGSVTSVRTRSELDRLLGFYLNTLGLRVDLSGDPSFREALRRTRDTVIDALSHADIPIHQVIRGLSLPRDASRSPLFQTMLVLEPPLPEPPLGWELSQLDVDVGRSRVDLYLEFDDRPGSLIGRVRYATALYERATVESMLSQLLTLVRAAIDNPDRRVGELPLLTDNDRATLMEAHNRVAPATGFEAFSPVDVEQSIAARFAGQVARSAGRPAVIGDDRTWTYRQLDNAADRVAAALIEACPTHLARVGVLARPCAAQVAAIVGILKAGGAYVPLDPGFPPKRIAAIVGDADLDLVLVDQGLGEFAREAVPDGTRVLDLPTADGRPPSRERIDRGSADQPAYLLYTSGSTGEPKGTLQSQRNVLHHVRAYTNALHLGPDDRVLLVAKATFDASVMDIFGALLNGAALCVVDLAAVGFVGLRDAVVAQRVTVYHSTPTVFREFVTTLDPGERLTRVRLVVLGGEEARLADFEAFRAHAAAGAVFVNGLGPTESTLALQYFADVSTVLDRTTVPVGYPVEATEVFLVDPAGRPTEFAGEIAIRSRYVALGYWNRPQLTAAAFVHDQHDPGLITYRTGDLGRRLADGSIEYAGRRDRQVKVRGIRVEVGEVEGAVAALPGVRQAAVEARPIDDDLQLVAYLVASPADRLTEHDVREALRDRLPEFMIPSSIVWLDRMPLTASNKVDRPALPAPAATPRDTPVTVPRDELEERFVAIWQELLARRPIGVADDFFELGGHSLLAVRLFDRIWRETGLRIPLSALLEGATIERLAARIREGRDGQDGLIAVQPRGTRPPVFMVPGAGSRILYLRNLAHHLGGDQPLYALHQPPTGPSGHADRRVEDLASHYATALRRIQPVGPYHLVGFSFGGAVAYEIAQQLIAAGETVAMLALIDSRNPVQPLPAPGFHPRFVARRIANQARILRRLGPRTGAAYLRQRLTIARDRSAIGLREMLDARLPALLRRVLWRDAVPHGEREWLAADGAAFDRYRPTPYPGRLTFLWAEHNQRPSDVFDTRRGWATLALGGMDVRPIPGSHLTVLVEPLAAITAGTLVDALRDAARGPAAGPRGRRADDPAHHPRGQRPD